MTVVSEAGPVIDRPGVVTTLVWTIRVADPSEQENIGVVLAEHWRRSRWPDGLSALSVFANLDGGSVLVYAQWSTVAPPDVARLLAPGLAAAPPSEYRLYRTVPGGGVSDPPPPAACFPVAFFVVEKGESGRGKIDEMLAAEEAKAGTRRVYPGGIAAHMHVGADDASVFVFSEWVSAELHEDHLRDLWDDLLAEGGHRALEEGAPVTGDRYRHLSTSTAAQARDAG
ncbi:hypothetical protein ACFVJR_27135 [Nocardia salmonicida]|uniref:hypothetical protein n=2 Tax=Nocardia salmonicida TaxID=53431 RepID=UPI003644D714